MPTALDAPLAPILVALENLTQDERDWLRKKDDVKFQCRFRSTYDELRITVCGVDGAGLGVSAIFTVECNIYDQDSYCHDLALIVKAGRRFWLSLRHPIDDD